MLHRVGLAVLLTLGAPVTWGSETLVLLPATGANVGAGELTAATDLLRGDLEQTGRFTVRMGQRPGGNVPEPTPAEAADEAHAARASLAVTLRVSRLGSAATARLAAYRSDGSLAHADSLGAASPDDLEPVLRRLARGLADARPAAELAEIDTVTEREAAPYRKRTATHVRGLRLGAAWMVDRPGDGETKLLPGGGMFWLYDARGFLAEVALDYAARGGNHLLTAGLSAYVPLSRSDLSPYLGGGVDWMAAHTQGETDAGLAVRAAGGVLIGRTSTVQLRLEAGWRFSLFRMEVEGDRQRIQGPFLTAGVGF